MRYEVLMGMSLEQLDQYGRLCGIDVSGRKAREDKVALIEERRARVAEIDVLGTTLRVPVRAMHDKRVTDLLNGGPLTDEQASALMEALLGEEQRDKVVELCTDEDGAVDVEAMALAFATVVRSPELKNF